MVLQPQKTKFQKIVIENFAFLNSWSINPWRRYSLTLILFLIGYFFGSSFGMISAFFEIADPIGALFFVFLIESFILIRRKLINDIKKNFFILLIDFLRIGLFYGFFTEGLKLL